MERRGLAAPGEGPARPERGRESDHHMPEIHSTLRPRTDTAHACTHARTHAHTYARTRTHTHTHTQIPLTLKIICGSHIPPEFRALICISHLKLLEVVMFLSFFLSLSLSQSI